MTAYRVALLLVLVPAWIAVTVALYRAWYRRLRPDVAADVDALYAALRGDPEPCSCPMCARRDRP